MLLLLLVLLYSNTNIVIPKHLSHYKFYWLFIWTNLLCYSQLSAYHLLLAVFNIQTEQNKILTKVKI